MKKIYLTFLIAAFASAAWAQDTPKKPSFAGFVSNGFWDNWEISVGAGAGTAFSNGSNLKSFGDRIGFEGNFSLTKWVHPVVGLRAQLQGGWFNNYDPEKGKMDWPYMFVHTDVMLNVSNWIGGYREDRAWYAVPFVGFGYMASNFTDKSQRDFGASTNQELAFTYGLLSKFRLSPAFDFNIELKGLLAKSELCPAQMNGQYLLGFSATAGLTYRFNKRNWQRGVPGYTAADIQAFQDAVAASMAAAAALEAQYTIVAEAKGERPILLLDDLFDKLDAGRVEQLIRLVSDDAFGQILITDCNPTRLKTILDKAGGDYALFSVADGTVTQERTAANPDTPES